MKKNNKTFCYWVNSCGKYICCHDCLSKNCIYRCTDNLKLCKYKVDQDRSQRAPKFTSSEDNVKNNVISKSNSDTDLINAIGEDIQVETLSSYKKFLIDKLPTTLSEFSSMIKNLYKLKLKDKPTIYYVELFKHSSYNNIDTLYAYSYIEMNSKLRKLRKILKKK